MMLEPAQDGRAARRWCAAHRVARALGPRARRRRRRRERPRGARGRRRARRDRRRIEGPPLRRRRRLFGVLVDRRGAAARAPGLLLLNAGAIHHVGPNRLYVTLARRWAARGHAVAAHSTSSGHRRQPRRAPASGERRLRAERAERRHRALAYLRRQPGVDRRPCVGLCSGGYNAFKARSPAPRSTAVVLINPLTFFSKRGHVAGLRPRPPQRRDVRSATRGTCFSPQAWKKMLPRRREPARRRQIVVRHGANLLPGRAHDLARRLGPSRRR